MSFSVKPVQVRSIPQSKKHLLAASITILSSILGIASSAYAEGSKDLYPSGYIGSRANIEWRKSGGGIYGGVLIRRTLLKVYAKAGETILFGSSAVGVSNGATTGDILLYAPTLVTGSVGAETIPASPTLDCNTQAVKGFIASRAEELAGPTPPAGGYAPCRYPVPTTGVYDVVFTGPDGVNAITQGNPTGNVADTPNNFNSQQGSSISTWDVTVRTDPNNAATNQDGRLFTYYLTAFTGDNGRPLNSTIYPVTTDGYRYQTAFKGLDPNGFVAFGSRSGFLNTDGTPLYRDALAGGTNPGQLETIAKGVTMARPEFPIFFNRSDITALTALSIPTNPNAPVVSSLTFTGTATAATSTENTGGTFTFNTNAPGSYQLVISNNGTDFDPTNPLNRVIRRQLTSFGTQTVVWDGKRNDGTFFPVNTIQPNYPVQATLRGGEYHFPLLDAENSDQGGPSVTLLNPPGTYATGFGPTTAFYDDRGYITADGRAVGTLNGSLCPTNSGTLPSPIFSNTITGYDSTTSARTYFVTPAVPNSNTNTVCGTGGFGDAKGLDLWTYFPSTAQRTQVIIVPSTLPQVNAIKSVKLITDADGSGSLTGGDIIRYTIVYNNTGTAAAAGFQITDTLPTDVTFVGPAVVTVAGAGTTAMANTSYNGTTIPNLLNAGATLGIGGTITVTIDATIKGTAIGNIFNQANGTSTTPGYPTGGVLTDTRDTTTAPSVPAGSIDQSIYPIGTLIDPTGITVVPPKPVLNKSVKRLPPVGTPLTFGDNVQYTIVLRNPNPVAPIQGVTVKDAIPTQLKFLTDAANLVTVTGSPFVRATTLPTTDFNGDGTTPIALTNTATLAAGATVTVTFNAKILPGAASPIANNALVNFTGDLGTAIRSDASDSTAPAVAGSGGGTIGTPNAAGDVTQTNNSALDDATILNIVSPVNPVGTKSVRLVDDKDGSGSVSVGDVVEYTVIYRNTSPSTDVNNFQITDPIDTTKLTFVSGSYTFATSDPATNVPDRPTYDGSTDPLMTGVGTLKANSSITIKFRATIIAPANTVIKNQASAASNGPISPSLTDAVSGPGDEPQILDDGIDTGNGPATGDDEPNLLTVKAPGAARLKLVKRVTGATRNGVPIAGLAFNQYITEGADDVDINAAGLTPLGLPGIPTLNSLRSADETEYTIYFLSDGLSFAQNVALCDLIPIGTTFVPTNGALQGITLRTNGATTVQTNAVDGDPGSFLAPLLAAIPTPNGCSNPAIPNGAAIVQLGTVTNKGPNNVGFFRFRVRVN